MVTSRDKIKKWFKTGAKPTQEQFYDWMDSYLHKDDDYSYILEGLEGYQFMGVATPDSVPSVPTQKVFYIANEVGKYPNYGGWKVEDGEIAFLTYDSNWNKTSINNVVTDVKLNNAIIDVKDDLNNSIIDVKDDLNNSIATSARYDENIKKIIFSNESNNNLFSVDVRLLAKDGDPRMKRLTAEKVEVGDMLFYDRMYEEYVIVKHSAIGAVIVDYDTKRYETNFDTYIGTFDGVAHFVSNRDAVSGNALFSDDVAATSCFYRIEIDNTKDGSITFSVLNGNATITDAVVSWKAGDTMSDIASAFATNKKDYINFAELADSKGVGVEVGGYGANTLAASATVNCEVIDCSGFAFMRSQNPSAPAVGGLFNSNVAYTYLSKGRHNNFRGATAVSILGNGLVGVNTVLLGNSGQNYSYRSGGNFARWKIWASTNGAAELKTDGVNGSANNSAGQVMSEAGFNANITSTASGDALKMYDYYNSLFSSQDDDYSAMRVKLEAMYGKMTTLYDAYLMVHMVDVSANTGILADIRNKGAYQSRIKGDCMNVNYNYVIIPAYPPEYNSQQFELANSEGFSKGRYYHPEVGDLGLMFRDDIMPIINENIAKVNGVQLNNSLYRGSSADYVGYNSWYFNGSNGCLDLTYRYSGRFRCRPVLALPLIEN